MVKYILFFSLLSFSLSSQTDTIKKSWYGRVVPLYLYTGAGTLNNKISQNIEIGRSYSVLDIGLSIGRFNLNKDTTTFSETRLTVDAFQLNNISSEFSIGGGYVFNSNTPIMLELSYTILVQVANKLGIGAVTGYYDFSGTNTDVNKTFFGVFIRYGLLRKIDAGLLSSKAKRHNHL
jgi:hypothetical protein